MGVPGIRAFSFLPLALAASCGMGARDIPQVYTAEIVADPAAMLGRPVRLAGTVAMVLPSEPPAYRLTDSSGMAVIVRCRIPPREGSTVRLLGQVAQNEKNVLEPVVIEAARVQGDQKGLMAFAVLGVGLLLFLGITGLELWLQWLARGGKKRLKPLSPPPRNYRPGDRLHVAILRGTDAGRHIRIGRGRATIGRGNARRNDIALTDPTVSRRQAVICYSTKRAGLFLVNQATTNPTIVAGKAGRRLQLKHGNIVRVGHTEFQILFEDPVTLPPMRNDLEQTS